LQQARRGQIGLITGSAVTNRAALHPVSVETRASWVVALTALGIYGVSFGAPIIAVAALKPITTGLAAAAGLSMALGAPISGLLLAGTELPVSRPLLRRATMGQPSVRRSQFAFGPSRGQRAVIILHQLFLRVLESCP
jgi:hypothetical protein